MLGRGDKWDAEFQKIVRGQGFDRMKLLFPDLHRRVLHGGKGMVLVKYGKKFQKPICLFQAVAKSKRIEHRLTPKFPNE